jgi:hypothetical protein
VKRNLGGVGKLFHDGIKLHTNPNRKKKNHFETARQFARHSSVTKAADYEFMMKVINSPVENRVEKHR